MRVGLLGAEPALAGAYLILDYMKNLDSKLIFIDEKELEVFANILHIKNSAKKEYGKDMSIDQAMAMYILSKIMGGAYFFELKCNECGK